MRISSLLSSLSVPLFILLSITSTHADPIAYVNAYSEDTFEINPSTGQPWRTNLYADALCGVFFN